MKSSSLSVVFKSPMLLVYEMVAASPAGTEYWWEVEGMDSI
jgi:hypothetical protein